MNKIVNFLFQFIFKIQQFQFAVEIPNKNESNHWRLVNGLFDWAPVNKS